MCNPLHATSIDGQNAVTLLDSSIPVCRAASKYLVNLKRMQIIFKNMKFQQPYLLVFSTTTALTIHVQPGYSSTMFIVPQQSLLLLLFALLIFALMSPLNWGDDVVYYRSTENTYHKRSSKYYGNCVQLLL
jgi:hypothetical protein